MRLMAIAIIVGLSGAVPADNSKPNANPLAGYRGPSYFESGQLERPAVANGVIIAAVRLTPTVSGATLDIDHNAPGSDEGGIIAGLRFRPRSSISVTFKFVKEEPAGRRIYDLVGDKLETPLSLVITAVSPDKCAPLKAPAAAITFQLLVRDRMGKAADSIPLQQSEIPTPPCHPGCFPAGTLIETPDGRRRIETIRGGDVVLNVAPDGKTNPVKVASVFAGQSVLVEVETSIGTLTTTAKQPLFLLSGEAKTSSTLVPGDLLRRWPEGQAMVKKVRDTSKPAPIFNLVLETPGAFVANGYRVKSKPPACTP